MKSEAAFTDRLKLFCMQNLLLESDLARLEESGLEIGHKDTIKRDDPVDVALFELDIVTRARKMADFYVLYYALEDSIRRLIAQRLREKYGANWWDLKVPKGVRDNVEKLQLKEKESPMSIRSDDPLEYTNFGELIALLCHFSQRVERCPQVAIRS